MARSALTNEMLAIIEGQIRSLTKNYTNDFNDGEVNQLSDIADMIAQIRIPITVVEHK